MLASIRLIAFVLLGSLTSASGVSAQTVVEVATKWGLLGTWQLDCKAPVSRTNAALSYVVRGGKLFHDRQFGDSSDSSAITSAKLKPGGMIEITVHFTSISQTRQQVDVKRSDGRRRTMSNRNVDTNEYSVKDGKFTAKGGETPWQTRCR